MGHNTNKSAITVNDGVPFDTTNKLYSDAGILIWNGTAIAPGPAGELPYGTEDGALLYWNATAGQWKQTFLTNNELLFETDTKKFSANFVNGTDDVSFYVSAGLGEINAVAEDVGNEQCELNVSSSRIDLTYLDTNATATNSVLTVKANEIEAVTNTNTYLKILDFGILGSSDAYQNTKPTANYSITSNAASSNANINTYGAVNIPAAGAEINLFAKAIPSGSIKYYMDLTTRIQNLNYINNIHIESNETTGDNFIELTSDNGIDTPASITIGAGTNNTISIETDFIYMGGPTTFTRGVTYYATEITSTTFTVDNEVAIYVIDCRTANVTATLYDLAATVHTSIVTFKKIGSFNLIINAFAGDLIDGQPSYTLSGNNTSVTMHPMTIAFLSADTWVII